LLDQRAALAGKVALVAGGGGGLGRAVSLDLAAAGARLALGDIDPGALADTAARAREAGAEVLDAVLDVRDPQALAGLFARAEERFGPLEVLVAVVGGTFRAPFTELSAKGREALVRTNFTWVAEATQLAARQMQASGRGGSIVVLTSIEAHRAAPGFAVYAAMKAAVTHLVRTLAVELGPWGIRVNCVAPDFVPTAGLAHVASSAGSGAAAVVEAGREADAGDRLTIPLGRKGRPEEVSSCVLFLASALSSYVTGTVVHPDGGALAASGWWRWPGEGFVARPPASVLEGLEGPDTP
jgi:3-oxoacyl-[acyl-carrier protein] reductase